jgi:hypothetical protein
MLGRTMYRRMHMAKTATRMLGALTAVICAGSGLLSAQSCVTQAKMSAEMRSGLAASSLTLARAVQAGDAAQVQSLTVPQLAGNQDSFQPTALLIHTTANQVAQDTLQVTQVYALDARGRTPGQSGAAEFSCPLVGTTSETDFSFDGLPPGMYGFAMVEATGSKPWLLAFLLRQDASPAGAWKMAGFYPRTRTAAGHDGGWYWKTAYDDGNAGQRWLAWLLFGEADQLLRPASFVTSTKLDSLRSEQRTDAPPELANGLAPDVPLLVKAADGAEFRFTSVDATASDDGARLELMLHMKADWLDDAAAAQARNQAAAKAFVDAHPEVRPAFDTVVVFAESPGHNPATTEQKMAAMP